MVLSPAAQAQYRPPVGRKLFPSAGTQLAPTERHAELAFALLQAKAARNAAAGASPPRAVRPGDVPLKSPIREEQKREQKQTQKQIQEQQQRSLSPQQPQSRSSPPLKVAPLELIDESEAKLLATRRSDQRRLDEQRRARKESEAQPAAITVGVGGTAARPAASASLEANESAVQGMRKQMSHLSTDRLMRLHVGLSASKAPHAPSFYRPTRACGAAEEARRARHERSRPRPDGGSRSAAEAALARKQHHIDQQNALARLLFANSLPENDVHLAGLSSAMPTHPPPYGFVSSPPSYFVSPPPPPPPPPMRPESILSDVDDDDGSLRDELGRRPAHVRHASRRILAWPGEIPGDEQDEHDEAWSSPPLPAAAHSTGVDALECDPAPASCSTHSGGASHPRQTSGQGQERASVSTLVDIVPTRVVEGATEGRPAGAASAVVAAAAAAQFARTQSNAAAAAMPGPLSAAATTASAGPFAATCSGASCCGTFAASKVPASASSHTLEAPSWEAATWTSIDDDEPSPLIKVGVAPLAAAAGGAGVLETAASVARLSGRLSGSDITPRCDLLPCSAPTPPVRPGVPQNTREGGGCFSRTRLASAIGPSGTPSGCSSAALAAYTAARARLSTTAHECPRGAAATVAAAAAKRQAPAFTSQRQPQPSAESGFKSCSPASVRTAKGGRIDQPDGHMASGCENAASDGTSRVRFGPYPSAVSTT